MVDTNFGPWTGQCIDAVVLFENFPGLELKAVTWQSANFSWARG